MAEQQHIKTIGFKTIQLFKDQVLGIGSYGKVCKAECDGLLCAAKVIHETLFDPTAQQLIAPHREHRLPMRRFEQECEFLSTIRHPNIIQYLGMYQDPDTHLPVLLMELMDDSLTHFLESSPQPIPYHTQINICHDITLALRFLHSNGIVHRDLSSNNVLMIGNNRAKVTDFGMARLGDMNPRATQLTFTMCPGTDVYMPPEAVKDKPVYTEKIDCFSFGVITIQIMTRLFPQPGERRKEIEIENVGLVEKRISEQERRQNHISKVDPSHPLKAIALSCLKDKDVERPSAEELSRGVASLKQNHKYNESVKLRVREDENHKTVQREEAVPQQNITSHQIEILREKIRAQAIRLEENNQILKQKDETMATGQKEIEKLKDQHRREIEDERRVKNNEILVLTKRISELELQLSKKGDTRGRRSTISTIQGAEEKVSVKLKWKKGKKAPCKISNSLLGIMAATADESCVYVMENKKIFAYNGSTLAWSQLPDSISEDGALATVNDLLTLIGGRNHSNLTNQLFSLSTKGTVGAKWTEEFPPMPTKRFGACALCTNKALIVAGGKGDRDYITTTEVLNTTTLQWSTAVDLPQPAFGGVLVEISSESDHLYVMGGYEKYGCPIESVYTCSLNTLLQSCSPHPASSSDLSPSRVWRRVADIPAIDSAYVSLHDHLLAIGGKDSDNKPITAIHEYNPSTNSWEVVSHMAKPRCSCYAAVLPDNQLIVVGGCTRGLAKTDSVEISTSV